MYTLHPFTTPLASFPRRHISRTHRRRHQHHSSRTHRRRQHNHHNPTDTKFAIKPSADLQNLNLTIHVDELSKKATSKLRNFVSAGNEAVRDLQTLVTVDPSTRVVVLACKTTTLQFLAKSFLFTVLLVLGFRSLFRLRLFRGGKEDGVVVRRDRSLGGKEVVVGRSSVGGNEGFRVSDSRGGRGLERSRFVRRDVELPKWWPVLTVKDEKGVVVDREECRKEADRLIQVIMDNRMRGKDIMDDDIIQLRDICRTSGIRVSIDTANIRDNIYRASVHFVLNLCSSSPACSVPVHINGEDPREFIAGLAGDIGLESIRAARMVSAAVAARVRSRFLQAWALEMQDNHSAAVFELSKIGLILQMFPPDESSPEMEMVARGLGKQLKVEQRELLLHMFVQICGSENLKIAAEALGLMLSSNGSSSRHET